MNSKYKILLLNAQYFRGLNGSNMDAVMHALRYVFLRKSVEKVYIKKCQEIIKNEKLDLICMVEVEGRDQLMRLVGNGFLDNMYSFTYFGNKYGLRSILRKLPFWRKKGNAVVSKSALKVKRRFLKNGVKRLLYEVELPNKQKTKLFLFHFSLVESVRHAQFEELSELLGDVGSKILCGDFNIYAGLGELESLLSSTDLKLCKTAATYPAFAPKYKLDLFLHSDDLKSSVKLIQSDFSDHLPVLLEISV